MKVAIYAKDMDNDQFAEFRAWVVSKGTTDILEYRDTTPLRGRSGDKELKRLLQDVEKRRFSTLYIDRLEQIVGSFRPGAILVILELRKHKVRLVSRAEDWTDLSDQDLGILYLAHCLHQDSEEYQISINSRSSKARVKKKHNRIDD